MTFSSSILDSLEFYCLIIFDEKYQRGHVVFIVSWRGCEGKTLRGTKYHKLFDTTKICIRCSSPCTKNTYISVLVPTSRVRRTIFSYESQDALGTVPIMAFVPKKNIKFLSGGGRFFREKNVITPTQ